MNEKLLWYINLTMAVVVLTTLLLGGCLGSGQSVSTYPPPNSPTAQLAKTASRVGWAAPFTALGVGGGVFLVFMGMQKIGLATIAGSIAATVHTLVTARYAWVLALLGLLAYIATMYLGFRKQQRDKEKLATGFILGFQRVKDVLTTKGICTGSLDIRGELNKVMGAALEPEAEDIVMKVKAENANVCHSPENKVVQ